MTDLFPEAVGELCEKRRLESQLAAQTSQERSESHCQKTISCRHQTFLLYVCSIISGARVCFRLMAVCVHLVLLGIALRLGKGVLHLTGPLPACTYLVVSKLMEQSHHSLQALLDTPDTPLLLTAPLLYGEKNTWY